MIIAMKKAKVVVLKEDQDKLLKALQKQQVIMPINFDQQQTANPELQRTEDTLKLLKKYRGKEKFFVEPKVISASDFEIINPEHQALVTQTEYAHAEIARLQAEDEALENEIKVLNPFYLMDINLQARKTLKYANMLTGYIPSRNLERLNEFVSEHGGIVNAYETNAGSTSVMIACYFEDFALVNEGVRTLGFTEFELPVQDTLVRDIVDAKNQAREAIAEKIAELNKELERLAADIDKLKILNDQLLTRNELESVIPTQTLETMYLEGWVRVDQVDLLKQVVEKTVAIYDLEIVDPEEGETPPTALANKKFVSQFEPITDMFATPSYEGNDPNGVMAPWYWIIYGMMMGDVGYGLIMLLFFGFLIKAKRPKGNSLRMMKVFMYSGITTIFWGALFGSYFGFEIYPLLFSPMNEPLMMLILSIIIGTLHILTGIITRGINNLKAKNVLAAISDDFSWAAILAGGIFAALGMLPDIGIPAIIINIVSSFGLALVLIGVVLILIFGGRSKPSIIGKAIGGLGGLYGGVGIASDILSYSRILALSLSTAVISMVMNMMAGMLQANAIGFIFSFIVYIIGHGFNIGMGMLSAYVHDGRLQYIEFFGKFYDGGGYNFKPLGPKLKYIDEIK